MDKELAKREITMVYAELSDWEGVASGVPQRLLWIFILHNIFINKRILVQEQDMYLCLKGHCQYGGGLDCNPGRIRNFCGVKLQE